MEEVGQMAAGLLSSFHILRRKKKKNDPSRGDHVVSRSLSGSLIPLDAEQGTKISVLCKSLESRRKVGLRRKIGEPLV